MLPAAAETMREIRRKVEAGERLSFDDGLFLYSSEAHLHDVGALANLVRQRNLSWRQAAFIVALGRVAKATVLRGV